MATKAIEETSGVAATEPPQVIIESIQKRKDGTYVVINNGYPYHATLNETPDVYQQVLDMIKDGAEVADYAEPVMVKPSPAEAATDEYNRLRGVADFTIAPLQDAVELDEATEKEITDLKAWKQYRVLLSRVSLQPGYPNTIKWPSAPE
ncbi:tail fiber assembly protein [Pseudomonas spelaei]|nr:tail fiber assembly protein [Pseudomonas spelaei]